MFPTEGPSRASSPWAPQGQAGHMPVLPHTGVALSAHFHAMFHFSSKETSLLKNQSDWFDWFHSIPCRLCTLECFPGGSDGKVSACNVRDKGSIPGLGRSPGKGNGNPLQYSCLENSMDEGSLVGYSPRGHKESDMIERLHFFFVP